MTPPVPTSTTVLTVTGRLGPRVPTTVPTTTRTGVMTTTHPSPRGRRGHSQDSPLFPPTVLLVHLTPVTVCSNYYGSEGRVGNLCGTQDRRRGQDVRLHANVRE